MAPAASPAWAARVRARAVAGNRPPATEYHASHPAFSPVAAAQSPLTPTLTVSGSSARNAATRCRAAPRSSGTGGILTAATFGNSAIRPWSSSVKWTWVVRGLSYTHSGTDSSRVTLSYRPNTSSSVRV